MPYIEMVLVVMKGDYTARKRPNFGLLIPLPRVYNYLSKLSMSHQYTKFTGMPMKEEQPIKRRQARESEPPMMSNGSMFDKPPQFTKEKTYQVPEPPSRTNNKYIVQTQEADKTDSGHKGVGVGRTNDQAALRKQDGTTGATVQSSQSSKVLLGNRFKSPQIKTGQGTAQKPSERKYSNQISESHFSSKSSKELAGSHDLGLHRSNTDFLLHTQNASHGKIANHPQTPNANQQTLTKKTPRFSEPVNFSMDNFEQNVSEASTSIISVTETKKLTMPKQIQIPSNLTQKTSLTNPTNSSGNTPSAFKKEKQLKQTVSTQSTFNIIEESPRPSLRIEQKQPNSAKKTPDPPKLSDFQVGKEIGSGKFGRVYIVKHKLTGFICAMKSIPKDIIKEENILNQLTRELKIQMFLDHPNIIKLYSFFHDKDNIYLLLQIGSSGQLYKVIKEKTRLSESSAAFTIKQVCEAIRYLHFFKIIHRDLKPENIVIQSGTVKLCDFGWAVCRGSELRSTFCGTPLYVSPEILKGQQYDEKIDLWSIGILTYELLFGNIPFQINREEELIKIIKQDIVFPTNIPVSAEAKDFILKILKKNPGDRLKIGELLEHEFLKRCPEMAAELEN